VGKPVLLNVSLEMQDDGGLELMMRRTNPKKEQLSWHKRR
jgi:hypothetical protein